MFLPKHIKQGSLWLPMLGAGKWKFNPCVDCCASICPSCGLPLPTALQVTFSGVTNVVCNECAAYFNDTFILDREDVVGGTCTLCASPFASSTDACNFFYSESPWVCANDEDALDLEIIAYYELSLGLYYLNLKVEIHEATPPVAALEYHGRKSYSTTKPDCTPASAQTMTLVSSVGTWCDFSGATCVVDVVP